MDLASSRAVSGLDCASPFIRKWLKLRAHRRREIHHARQHESGWTCLSTRSTRAPVVGTHSLNSRLRSHLLIGAPYVVWHRSRLQSSVDSGLSKQAVACAESARSRLGHQTLAPSAPHLFGTSFCEWLPAVHSTLIVHDAQLVPRRYRRNLARR